MREEGTPAAQLDLRAALRNTFGHEDFRPFQEDIIQRILAGRDVLAVLPTGAGKSLCYQLPAALLKGPTLVVSPLISLMKDQFDNLPPDLYARATAINSSLTPSELDHRLRSIHDGTTSLIYAAPERLRQRSFLESMQRARIALVVVDEAHCVSVWGHDFRPDYLFISKALAMLGAAGPRPTLLAVTATATIEMQQEIAAQLGRRLEVVMAPLFRENLRLEVAACDNVDGKMHALLRILKETPGSAIVYASSRERCEKLAALLRRNGICAEHYHAGLDPEVRRATQERFMLGRTAVIAATVAFGMGIDKANVRLVAHFSLPKSLEAYSQEAGRAGRDGRPSRCVLLHASSDRASLTRWLGAEAVSMADLRAIYRELRNGGAAGPFGVDADELASAAFGRDADDAKRTIARVSIAMLEACGMLIRHPDTGRRMVVELLPAPAGSRAGIEALLQTRRTHAEARVEAMVRYATGTGCRHAALAAHFGQTIGPCRTACDRCSAPKVDHVPRTRRADLPQDVGRVILVTVRGLPFGLGRYGLAKVLHGSADAAMGPERCEAHGCLSAVSLSAVERTITELVERELLEVTPDDDFRRLRLTRTGEAALTETTLIPVHAPTMPTKRRKGAVSAADPLDAAAGDRFEILRAWRLGVARNAGVPAFMVLSDATLHGIARANPTTLAGLRAVHGIGPEKLRIIGEDILRLLHG